jgi:hypothetical protein
MASGATASSEGSQLVCRLPLAAFIPKTIDVESRRPAAVIRYVQKESNLYIYIYIFMNVYVNVCIYSIYTYILYIYYDIHTDRHTHT